jgi:hypothetical protein
VLQLEAQPRAWVQVQLRQAPWLAQRLLAWQRARGQARGQEVPAAVGEEEGLPQVGKAPTEA